MTDIEHLWVCPRFHARSALPNTLSIERKGVGGSCSRMISGRAGSDTDTLLRPAMCWEPPEERPGQPSQHNGGLTPGG